MEGIEREETNAIVLLLCCCKSSLQTTLSKMWMAAITTKVIACSNRIQIYIVARIFYGHKNSTIYFFFYNTNYFNKFCYIVLCLWMCSQITFKLNKYQKLRKLERATFIYCTYFVYRTKYLKLLMKVHHLFLY